MSYLTPIYVHDYKIRQKIYEHFGLYGLSVGTNVKKELEKMYQVEFYFILLELFTLRYSSRYNKNVIKDSYSLIKNAIQGATCREDLNRLLDFCRLPQSCSVYNFITSFKKYINKFDKLAKL